MKKIIFLIQVVTMVCLNTVLAQNNWTSARPDGHAPIGVMGDHYHKHREWMLSYRYMPMWMENNMEGSESIKNSDIFQEYMAAPQKMLMEMHMLGIMYAPTDNITLMLMANYITKSMDLKTRMNVDFKTESSGFGDILLAGLIKILNKERNSIHLNIAINVPAGDIKQRDDTPMMNNAKLAYPMQLGSGTWDIVIGATYLGQTDQLSWGIQPLYLYRIGENSEKYTLGNKIMFTGWGALRTTENLSFSISLSYINIGEIDGADADLNPMMMPLFNTANSGKNQLDAGFGGNFLFTEGYLKNLRFGVEIKYPLLQHVNGIQMENKIMLITGLQYSIGH